MRALDLQMLGSSGVKAWPWKRACRPDAIISRPDWCGVHVMKSVRVVRHTCISPPYAHKELEPFTVRDGRSLCSSAGILDRVSMIIQCQSLGSGPSSVETRRGDIIVIESDLVFSAFCTHGPVGCLDAALICTLPVGACKDCSSQAASNHRCGLDGAGVHHISVSGNLVQYRYHSYRGAGGGGVEACSKVKYNAMQHGSWLLFVMQRALNTHA